jgi:hypothetical protein
MGSAARWRGAYGGEYLRAGLCLRARGGRKEAKLVKLGQEKTTSETTGSAAADQKSAHPVCPPGAFIDARAGFSKKPNLLSTSLAGNCRHQIDLIAWRVRCCWRPAHRDTSRASGLWRLASCRRAGACGPAIQRVAQAHSSRATNQQPTFHRAGTRSIDVRSTSAPVLSWANAASGRKPTWQPGLAARASPVGLAKMAWRV